MDSDDINQQQVMQCQCLSRLVEFLLIVGKITSQWVKSLPQLGIY